MPITLPALLLACATATVQKGATTVTLKSMHIAGPVVGSEPAIGRVDLTAAPAAPTVISFSSSNPGTVPPPANLVIPGGQTWADFAIKTLPVAAETSATLTAHSGATSEAKAALTLIPPSLNMLDCEPKSLPGGSHATCKAWMNGAVATGGEPALTLKTSNSQVAWPANSTVTVPAGNRWTTFDVVVGDLPQSAKATISASYNGVTKTSDVEATPAALAAFGCVAVNASDTEHLNPRQECDVVGGDFLPGGNHQHLNTVGFAARLTARAPAAGYKVPLTIDVGAPIDFPKTLEVPAGKMEGFYRFKTSPVDKALSLTVSARDPISKNVYAAKLTIEPPVLGEVEFVQKVLQSVPLGGQDTKIHCEYLSPPPPHGLAFDVTYGGTTDIKGPARVRLDPENASTSALFTVRVFPCAVNPPCQVWVTVGNRKATATVKP